MPGNAKPPKLFSFFFLFKTQVKIHFYKWHMLCSFQHYHCRRDLYHCCFFGNYQIIIMIRFLTIRLLWLFQTPSGSTIVQSCTIETTQTSITWVSHYNHILDLLSIEYFLNPISILQPWPDKNTRCTEAEKTALQTTTNTLFVAQRIFTAFAVSILNELSGAIENWNEKPKQSRRI